MASVTVVTLMNRHLTCKGSRFHLFEVLKSSHSTAHSICTDTLAGKCGNRNKSFTKDSSLYVKGEFRSIPFMNVLERPFMATEMCTVGLYSNCQFLLGYPCFSFT